MNESNSNEMEVVSAGAMEQMERAQIDMQVTTAKKYPRDVKAFLAEAKSMIALDQDVAEGCNYMLKRKDRDGKIKIIEGPSVRLLEIAASAYGNVAYGSRVIGEDDHYVRVMGAAHDIQKNIRVTVEVARRITTKTGMRYGDDMIAVTMMAASAIARRNALNSGVIPRSYVNHLAAFAKEIARGDQRTLPERLQKAFDYFMKAVGVTEEQLLEYLDKPNRESCGLEEVDALNGLKTGLKDGEIKIDEAFPPKPEKPKFKNGNGNGEKPQATEAPADSVSEKSPQSELAEIVVGAGYTFDTFLAWAKETGQFHDADLENFQDFDTLPSARCSQFVKAKAGLLRGLKMINEGKQ